MLLQYECYFEYLYNHDPKFAMNLNVADHFNATVTPVCNSNIIHDSNSKASHVSNLHVTNLSI